MLEGAAWAGSMIPGEKSEGGPGTADYTGAEINSIEGGAETNYMYGTQAGHNGTESAEGY